MSIRRDNRDLNAERDRGNPPDPAPRFGHLLAQAWAALGDEHYHQRSRTDVERYIRLGWGGQCARSLGYKLLEVEETNPTDLAGTWRMNLGTMVHEALQEALQRAFPDAEMEKVIDASHDEIMGIPTSGRSDVFLVTDEGKRTVIEVKTINGFGFKMAVGARGAPEGPRTGALFQAALNGRAHGADEVVVLILSLECLSDRELATLVDRQGGEPDPVRKYVGEWSYSMAELDEMVDRELARLKKILGLVEERVDDPTVPLPPRSIPLEMPSRARVTDPMKGEWQVVVDGNVMDAGTVWQCKNYCGYRDVCAADGPS